ncbi:MAG: Nramp family divalent metal transporter [Patescibacteria group bacterium]|nr:Nramp family divalent metal transporter [Patescibacteria group bacterium]
MNKNNNQEKDKTFQKAEDILVKVERESKEGVKAVEDAAYKVSEVPPVRQAKNFWRGLGPGLTTGSADDDPSGIVTYSQTGAKYGFQLLWLAAFSFPLMAIVQEMCARIGLHTGRGLAHNIRQYFPRPVLYLVAILVLLANSFNIGADLGALAKASQLFWPNASFTILVIFFTIFCLSLQIFISYEKYARYLKYLAVLLGVYVVTAFVIKDFPWFQVLKNGLIPKISFNKEQIILICGIFGTTISPYLFFWETSQEIEEQIADGKSQKEMEDGVTDKAIKKMRIDVWVGMFFSNLAMFFIIAVCGAVLFPNGITNINSASDAAIALKPLAGNYAYLLFAIGIFSVGLLGIPVLAGAASYAVSESFGWKEGLFRKFSQAKAFYGVIIFSMLIGLAVNFIGLDPIKALIYAAVANGLVAPVILILIVLISSNKKVMGARANHRFITFMGWVATIVMVIVGLATIYSFF